MCSVVDLSRGPGSPESQGEQGHHGGLPGGWGGSFKDEELGSQSKGKREVLFLPSHSVATYEVHTMVWAWAGRWG